jgi:hypothetical protein
VTWFFVFTICYVLSKQDFFLNLDNLYIVVFVMFKFIELYRQNLYTCIHYDYIDMVSHISALLRV